jgi:subtilase family serine protease
VKRILGISLTAILALGCVSVDPGASASGSPASSAGLSPSASATPGPGASESPASSGEASPGSSVTSRPGASPTTQPSRRPRPSTEPPTSQADLAIRDVEVQLIGDDEVSISFRVVNEGTAPAGPFVVRASCAGLRTETGVDGLAAGGETLLDLPVILAGDPAPELPSRITVDPDDTVVESRSDNNQRAIDSEACVAAGPPEDLPDVEPFSGALDTEGQFITLLVSVRNVGTADAGHFTVRASCIGVVDEADVSGLAAGASTNVDLAFDIAYASEFGDPELQARITADFNDQVLESDEHNNVLPIVQDLCAP